MSTYSFLKFQKDLSTEGAEAGFHLYDYAIDSVVEMKIPFLPPVFFLLKPEDIHELLVKQGQTAEKVEFVSRIARSTFGNGILFSNGTHWKRQRKLMQPAFHHTHIKNYGERMLVLIKDHLSQWQSEQIYELAEEMHKLSLRIVVDALFSSDVRGSVKEISAAIEDIGQGFSAQASSLFLTFMPDWFPAPALRRKQRGAKVFNQLLSDLIAERRVLAPENRPEDLLTTLMSSQDAETGAYMSLEELRGELLTLYVAGHDTSAWLLAWAISFISQNPQVAEKLSAEAGTLSTNPSIEDYMALPYCRMVLQETLRLRPPVWFLQRQAHEVININGRDYPAKSIFFVMVYSQQQDETIFPDAKIFKPERWENDAEKQIPKGAYLPFATGPHICIGNGFAMLEAQLILSSIMRDYKIELLDKPEIMKGTPIILGFDRPIRFKITSR